ncbi:hypothetical protein [Rheinheimera sp.]|uniref:hypothetical protein n=1 Tax=Rheinheimera sp. TaxID=1869214 RepID=UPI003D2C1489
MKTEQLSRTRPPELFPTAGYGSVAPPWIKADLQQTAPAKTKVHQPENDTWHWLRRQLGWHQS